jgi:hypothetical protein
MSVAETILQQLGGRARLSIMTGAKNFVGDHNSLSFMLPQNMTKDRINVVRVTLTPEDLYEIEYLRVQRPSKRLPGGQIDTLHHSKGVFVETMKRDIETNTGLYLSL